MPNVQSSDETAADAYALPLIVAVTGHRDLLGSEIPDIRVLVKDLLIWLGEHFPERRLNHADDDTERRLILSALGDSALDEHAEWILMRRDRSLDQGEIWRMGS